MDTVTEFQINSFLRKGQIKFLWKCLAIVAYVCTDRQTDIMQLLTFAEVDMKFYWTVKFATQSRGQYDLFTVQ